MGEGWVVPSLPCAGGARSRPQGQLSYLYILGELTLPQGQSPLISHSPASTARYEQEHGVGKDQRLVSVGAHNRTSKSRIRRQHSCLIVL